MQARSWMRSTPCHGRTRPFFLRRWDVLASWGRATPQTWFQRISIRARRAKRLAPLFRNDLSLVTCQTQRGWPEQHVHSLKESGVSTSMIMAEPYVMTASLQNGCCVAAALASYRIEKQKIGNRKHWRKLAKNRKILSFAKLSPNFLQCFLFFCQFFSFSGFSIL